jgi:uncharacterized protein (DUF58 family)
VAAPRPSAGVHVALADLLHLEHQARGFSFLPRQPVHSLLAGRRASRIRGRGLDFEELRAYLPGDDVRTIDWRVTARTKKPFVRVFSEERDRPVLLVVDQRANMFFGSKRAMKSVVAAEAAALAAWRALSVGDRVGALVFDDADVAETRPHRSRRTVLRVLGAVVAKNQALRADPDAPPSPAQLNQVLARAARLANHDHLVVILSDFDGADAETRRHVSRMAQHNDVLCGLVHDPLAKELPAGRRLVVSDGVLQVEVDTASGARRQRLLDVSADRAGAILAWQTELGIPVLPLTTAGPVAEQVRQHLGRAPRKRR